MPIYEYSCPKCHTKFEELIRSERANQDVVCPNCGERKVRREPSVFAAHAAAPRSTARPAGCGGCGGGDGACPYAG